MIVPKFIARDLADLALADAGDLHVPVTNPSPDLPVHLRKGENLYTNSIVCLDVRTGKRRWHRSLVPNDSHDWDLTHASPLISASVGGKQFIAAASGSPSNFWVDKYPGAPTIVVFKLP